MDVKAVRDEIGQKLGAIAGLRVYAYVPDKVPPPGAVVGMPDGIEFDQTYGRGSDEMTIPLWVVVARIDARAGDVALVPYLNGSGAKSIKAAVDSTTTNTYTSCDTVTVTTAAVGGYTWGGVEMLGAEFTVRVSGSGA